MPSPTNILVAAVCAFCAATASVSASGIPSSFLYEAYADLEAVVDVVDVQMSLDVVGFGALVAADLASQEEFGGPQAAGLMFIVEYDGTDGQDAEVSLYRTPNNYDGSEDFSTLSKLNNNEAGLTVHFANSTFVSVTFEGALSLANGTDFDFFAYASTSFQDDGSPVLPDLFSFNTWEDAIVVSGRAPQLQFSNSPTAAPTVAPTIVATLEPTASNFTLAPTSENSTMAPSIPDNFTLTPTTTNSTMQPTGVEPTFAPTRAPSTAPTKASGASSLAAVGTLTAFVLGVAQMATLL